MSSGDSYLFNHQLPDNETFKTTHNIVVVCTCVAYGFSYLIIYLSPPNKESHYYKMLMHAQGALLFLFSIIWSLLLKPMLHINYNFGYCEGYCYLIGLTCANGFTLFSVVFGSYAACVTSSYLFRLYLIVDHTHFLRTPHLFPIICALIEFFFSFVTSVTFYNGYSQFEPNNLPFNLSHEQLDYMSMRTVLSYKLKTFKEIFYPVYSVLLVLIVGVVSSSQSHAGPKSLNLIHDFQVVVITAFEIVRTIHKKQSVMSTGASSHHLRVLKVLTIQVVCTLSLSFMAPFAIALTFFFPISSTVVYGCAVLLGTNSLVQSVLTICLNPVSRKTVLTLVGFHKPTARVYAK